MPKFETTTIIVICKQHYFHFPHHNPFWGNFSNSTRIAWAPNQEGDCVTVIISGENVNNRFSFSSEELIRD